MIAKRTRGGAKDTKQDTKDGEELGQRGLRLGRPGTWHTGGLGRFGIWHPVTPGRSGTCPTFHGWGGGGLELAELDQVLEGTAVEAGVAGFVAAEIDAEAVVHELAHTEGDAVGFGDMAQLLFEIGGGLNHGVLDGLGFDGPDVAEAPGGGDGLLY